MAGHWPSAAAQDRPVGRVEPVGREPWWPAANATTMPDSARCAQPVGTDRPVVEVGAASASVRADGGWPAPRRRLRPTTPRPECRLPTSWSRAARTRSGRSGAAAATARRSAGRGAGPWPAEPKKRLRLDRAAAPGDETLFARAGSPRPQRAEEPAGEVGKVARVSYRQAHDPADPAAEEGERPVEDEDQGDQDQEPVLGEPGIEPCGPPGGSTRGSSRLPSSGGNRQHVEDRQGDVDHDAPRRANLTSSGVLVDDDDARLLAKRAEASRRRTPGSGWWRDRPGPSGPSPRWAGRNATG